jgi:hypothetical protein
LKEKKRTIMTAYKNCPSCGGRKYIVGKTIFDRITCQLCDGKGFVEKDTRRTLKKVTQKNIRPTKPGEYWIKLDEKDSVMLTYLDEENIETMRYKDRTAPEGTRKITHFLELEPPPKLP